MKIFSIKISQIVLQNQNLNNANLNFFHGNWWKIYGKWKNYGNFEACGSPDISVVIQMFVGIVIEMMNL